MPAEIFQIGDIDDLARTVARELLADGKAGKLAKIGIDEVRAAIAARAGTAMLDAWQAERLETKTLRCLIEGV
jgi:hypothetical protein